MICVEKEFKLGPHEEWDPSEDTDVSQVPVGMIVNSSELRSTDFDLREVIHNTTTRVVTTMSSGHDVSEYIPEETVVVSKHGW
jgi:hypothetical protein